MRVAQGAHRRGSRLRWRGGWGLLLAACAAHASGQALTGELDATRSAFGVELRTRWGQVVEGRFPDFEGQVAMLDGDRRQVRVRLTTATVRIGDSPRYSAMARGDRFFDSGRHPSIEFISDPIDLAMVEKGGPLRGRLTIRGVTRIERFLLLPASCARPGIDCDFVATGGVDRHDYGLDGWRLALDDTVRFTMRVRLAEEPAP
ncbi:YceI family protein [Lysobacter sp. SG-8]|uniref:YceI family protein n=1 Tax=Marilutibacter penaei TaxID=2759900 RepID=A0A7W3U1R6_9GAMM|nr:YceI family protein [Lysobacter penaei]MBB1087309.1 YceI family protein [Lysobacter penaei]